MNLRNFVSFVIIFLLLSLCFGAQEYPVQGEEFQIKYDPATTGILAGSNSITAVYAFDYWGTKGSARRGAESLFRNVQQPDPGREHRVEMEKSDQYWTAKINIPTDAALLSYYFTNGDEYDYNDKKTYVTYIKNKKGKIAKNARFRNVAFLAMAGKDAEAQAKEAQKEISHYPKNWLAYISLWQKKFKAADSMAELKKLRREADKQYNSLVERYGVSDSIKNIKAGYLYNYNNAIGLIVRNEYESTREEFMDVMASIEPENRLATTAARYNQLKKYEERKKQSQKFNQEIKGKAAPDFEFTTLEGETHKLSDFEGDYVLLDFWGTWCGPCVGEIPHLKEAYQKYHDQGFEIISISSDGMNENLTEDELENWVDDRNMNWIHVMDKRSRRIHKMFKVNSWPTMYLINPKGKVIKLRDELRGKGLISTLESVL
mgnify:CR=1 FL=1